MVRRDLNAPFDEDIALNVGKQHGEYHTLSSASTYNNFFFFFFFSRPRTAIDEMKSQRSSLCCRWIWAASNYLDALLFFLFLNLFFNYTLVTSFIFKLLIFSQNESFNFFLFGRGRFMGTGHPFICTYL